MAESACLCLRPGAPVRLPGPSRSVAGVAILRYRSLPASWSRPPNSCRRCCRGLEAVICVVKQAEASEQMRTVLSRTCGTVGQDAHSKCQLPQPMLTRQRALHRGRAAAAQHNS